MLRIVGWTLLLSFGAATVVLARVMAENRRKINELEAQLHDIKQVDATLARTQQDQRRHLRLLGVLPPVAWLAANLGRRQAALAAAAAVSAALTASGVQVDDDNTMPRMQPPRAAEAATLAPPATLPEVPVASHTRPAPTTTSTTAPLSVLPSRVEAQIDRPAPTTTIPSPAPTTTVVPPVETTTTLPLPPVTVDPCIGLEGEALGLQIAAGLCPAPSGPG